MAFLPFGSLSFRQSALSDSKPCHAAQITDLTFTLDEEEIAKVQPPFALKVHHYAC